MKNNKFVIAQNSSNNSNEVVRADNNTYVFALVISIVVAILFVIYKFYNSKKKASVL